jgi:hypothetical protein
MAHPQALYTNNAQVVTSLHPHLYEASARAAAAMAAALHQGAPSAPSSRSVVAPATVSSSSIRKAVPPKKSEDELAAAAVLLGLTSRDEENTNQHQLPSSSLISDESVEGLPPKKGVGYKKAVTKKTSTLASKQAMSNVAAPASTCFRPTPVAATNNHNTGHVSDENSSHTAGDPSFEDSSVENNSRTHSPAGVMMVLADGTKFFSGSVSLSLPEDDDVLSPLHCFMRKYCVEAFSASPEDVATPRYGKSHGFKVEAGQVGIRCLYCKHLPIQDRPERSVCFPSSLANIYHSMETWQRRHSLVCTHISPWVKKSIVELMESSKTRAGGRRKYWEDSATQLGMVDTPRGVRFIRSPGDLGPTSDIEEGDVGVKRDGCEPVVREEDRDLVTPYLYLLLEQMQTCFFTEEDRTGGRSKIKDIELNFPGYECRHCLGKAGFGRYFPSSVAALSLANSDRNVYNHLQKCRRCPPHVKNELVRLSKEQSQSKNKRGLRKLFFSRIWDRMHGTNSSNDATGAIPVESSPIHASD